MSLKEWIGVPQEPKASSGQGCPANSTAAKLRNALISSWLHLRPPPTPPFVVRSFLLSESGHADTARMHRAVV